MLVTIYDKFLSILHIYISEITLSYTENNDLILTFFGFDYPIDIIYIMAKKHLNEPLFNMFNNFYYKYYSKNEVANGCTLNISLLLKEIEEMNKTIKINEIRKEKCITDFNALFLNKKYFSKSFEKDCRYLNDELNILLKNKQDLVDDLLEEIDKAFIYIKNFENIIKEASEKKNIKYNIELETNNINLIGQNYFKNYLLLWQNIIEKVIILQTDLIKEHNLLNQLNNLFKLQNFIYTFKTYVDHIEMLGENILKLQKENLSSHETCKLLVKRKITLTEYLKVESKKIKIFIFGEDFVNKIKQNKQLVYDGLDKAVNKIKENDNLLKYDRKIPKLMFKNTSNLLNTKIEIDMQNFQGEPVKKTINLIQFKKEALFALKELKKINALYVLEEEINDYIKNLDFLHEFLRKTINIYFFYDFVYLEYEKDDYYKILMNKLFYRNNLFNRTIEDKNVSVKLCIQDLFHISRYQKRLISDLDFKIHFYNFANEKYEIFISLKQEFSKNEINYTKLKEIINKL